jgi:dihydrofolate reductase
MQPLRYSINVTLDGCCDHTAVTPDEDMHRHAGEWISAADALLFGRVTYEMMEAAWRKPAETGVLADWMTDWMAPFARAIHVARKYVVSKTLEHVDWNAEIVRPDQLEQKVRELKAAPGRGIATGGVQLPLALAELGLIDEYQLVVHPRIAGQRRTLFAGLSKPLALRLLGRQELASGAVATRYAPRS